MAAFAALLTPQGKILFDFFVIGIPDQFLIDCHRDSAAALLKRLTLYKLRADVSMAVDEDVCVVVSGEESDNAVASFADPRLDALGWRAVDRKERRADSHPSYKEKRIALGVPEFGDDFAEEGMFLLDVNYDVLNGVSYKKGCFVGQEVTSRMKRKGDARRRTLMAQFDGDPRWRKPPAVTARRDDAGGNPSERLRASALALIRVDRWERARSEGVSPQCEGRALQLVVPDYLEPR